LIIKGGARSGAGALAVHLQRVDTNEQMQVRELRGVAGVTLTQALREMEAHGCATRCKAPLYHASISPRADEVLTPEQWTRAVDRLEAVLGLTDQPRVVVAHVKEGRAHLHAVWSRIDLEKLRAISDSWNYAKHEQAARDLEREFGLSRIQGAHVERDGAARPTRTPSPAEMSQSERSGIDPQARKAELTALWHAADSGAAFAAAAENAGYQLARGDRRAYVVVDAAGEVYALARQLAGVTTAAVRARLADLPDGAVPDVGQACAIQAARNQARKDAPPPMNTLTPAGLTLEEQRRAELATLQEQQEATQRAEQIARDDAQKRQEVERITGLAREAQAAELAKLEGLRLEQLHQQQERAAAFLAERERQAEDAKRSEAERARAEARTAETVRVQEGAIRNAGDRYAQALGSHYDVANPFGSLARTAMAEAGAFSRDQEALRQQAAAEEDPGKRQLLTLQREIEAKEHFAQAGARVARINEALTTQPDRHWQAFAEAQAAEAVQLREQYRALVAEQEKAKVAKVQPAAPAPQQQAETVRAPGHEAAASKAPTPAPTQDRQAQRDQEARAALAQEHTRQREALAQRQASEAERKALAERQRQEARRLEMLQNKREIERTRAKESGRER
jgi:hypothetical protein